MLKETIKTNSFTMSYIRFGKSGATPVVIIPGLSVRSVLGAAAAIENAYAYLAGTYDIYLFDRRSDVPKPYSIEQMADDTAEAMEQAGIRNAYLFGVSQGGMIAQVIAVGRPDLVKGMMLGSTSAYVNENAETVIGTWIRLAKERKIAELARSFGEAVYTDSFFEKYEAPILAMCDGVTQAELEKFITLAQGTAGFDMRNRLDTVRCPVLVIGAGKDRVFGSTPSKELAEAVHGQCFIYEDYGHAVYDEAPDYLVRVKEFFDEK